MRTMDKMLLWSSAWSKDEYWRNLEEQQKNEQNDKIMRTTLSGNEDYCGTVGKAERTDENDIEKVNHPKHYNSHPSGIECIEIVRHYNFDVGNAIKYLWRHGLKHEEGIDDKDKAVEDLEKAIFYINDEIKRIKDTE